MFIIRTWEWNKDKKEYRLTGSSYETLQEARQEYDAIVLSKDIPQKELIEEEYDDEGNLIYEYQIDLQEYIIPPERE